MKIRILTLFPQMFPNVLQNSILGRAEKNNIIDFEFVNIRDYSIGNYNKVDDYPFGGGKGMVMMAKPITDALKATGAEQGNIVYMSPRGEKISENLLREFAEKEEFTIVCGHYEGIDERVIDYWQMREVSIGDYVLTGGELPAMVFVDAMARLIPDVLSKEGAAVEESIYSGLLEYPQYTKPREFEGLEVPQVLVSGNHKLIELWKFEEALKLTKVRRPDLFDTYIEKNKKNFTKQEIKIVNKLVNEAEKL
ncbi:MAG: tRNA (guanosine(37)-N1)-methyltransferase TrmD [Eubacteriales bacterium]